MNALDFAIEMQKRIEFCDKMSKHRKLAKNLRKGVSFKEHMRRHEMNALDFPIEILKCIGFSDKMS